jgi:hypothetical protein
MYPMIPPEMMGAAVQMVIYFFTAVVVLVSFMLYARA